MIRRPPKSPLLPYTTLSRSHHVGAHSAQPNHSQLHPVCSPPISVNEIWSGMSGNCFLQDRKSTRLNSSHSQISYAVFCLKKKTIDLTMVRLGICRFPDQIVT